MSRSRRTAVIALGAVCAVSSFGWILTAFMFSAYKIPSEAMTPSVAPGDRVLARHIGGHRSNPAAGIGLAGTWPSGSWSTRRVLSLHPRQAGDRTGWILDQTGHR
jgi:hypothetical protein